MLKLSNIFNCGYSVRRFIDQLFFELGGVLSVRIYLISTVLINILGWLTAYSINSQALQDEIALHYNVDFGINLIGDVHKLYITPVIGLLIFIVNISIIGFISRHDKFLIHVLFAISLISNIILLIGLATLYLINFR